MLGGALILARSGDFVGRLVETHPRRDGVVPGLQALLVGGAAEDAFIHAAQFRDDLAIGGLGQGLAEGGCAYAAFQLADGRAQILGLRRLAQGGLGELGGDHGLGEIVGGVSGSFLGQRAVGGHRFGGGGDGNGNLRPGLRAVGQQGDPSTGFACRRRRCTTEQRRIQHIDEIAIGSQVRVPCGEPRRVENAGGDIGQRQPPGGRPGPGGEASGIRRDTQQAFV